MKGNLFSIFFLLIACVSSLISCTHNESDKFSELEERLVANPDSVYDSVKKQLADPGLSERDRMYLTLLSTEAGDKADHPDTTQATIRALQNHFLEKGNDPDLHPRVNYILGRMHAERHENPQAVEYFRKALRLSDEQKDRNLRMRIFSQLAYLCGYSGLHRHALEYSRKWLENASRDNDSLSAARANLLIAYEFRALNRPDSALAIYERISPIYQRLNDSQQSALYVSQYASYYMDMGMFEKADSLLKDYRTDCIDTYAPTLTSVMARLNAHLGESEEMEKSSLTLLYSTNNLYAKKTAADNLVRLYISKADISNIRKYYDVLMQTTDSILKLESASIVAELEKYYTHSELEEENRGLKEDNAALQNKITLWIISSLLVVVIMIIFILTMKNRQLLKEKQASEEKNRMQQQINDMLADAQALAHQIQEKEVEIREKRKELARLQDSSNKSEDIIESLRKDLSEEKNRMRQQINDMLAEAQDLKRQLDQKDIEIDEKRKELTRLQDSSNKSEDIIESLRKDLSEEKNRMQQQINDISAKAQDLKLQLDQKDIEIDKKRKELAELQVSSNNYSVIIESLRKDLKDAETKNHKLHEDFEFSANEISNLRDTMSRLMKEIREKEEEKSMMYNRLNAISKDVDNISFKSNFVDSNQNGANEKSLHELKSFVKNLDNHFYEKMKDLGLPVRDFHDTLLIRLEIRLVDCGKILKTSPATIKMKRKRNFNSIKDKKGEKTWEDYVLHFSSL